MQHLSFSLAESLRPELLQENRGVAIFDLNVDGWADLHLVRQTSPDTLGLDFVSDLPGGQVFRMRTVPSGPPPRRIPFGRLPDGRSYYLVPGSTSLPQGPVFDPHLCRERQI